MDTLSVCIIARNEEANLTRCLKSIKSIADEIILIDTGSTDNTINIAQEFNAKIIKFPWNDDFSSARNKALEIASKDWILYIDCDESLDNSKVSELKDMLNDSLYLGFRLKLINIIDNKPYKGEYLLRIIRNNSGFYFSGKLNEKLNNSLYNDSYLNKIFNLEFLLYNFGYDYSKKQLVDRCNRNLSIYLSYDDEEKNYLYYYNIANEYFLLNKYNIAINNYIKAIELNDNYYINSYISFLIVKTYYKAKKYKNAILNGESYLFKNDAFREIYLLISLCYKKLNNLEKSRENLKLYLELYKENSPYCFSLDYINFKNFIPEMLGFNLENLKKLN